MLRSRYRAAMALDHYVSQVHLRNFYSPSLGELMHAVRKSDLKQFQCNSRSVCRIEQGSTNAYLDNERAIEEFLKVVEPQYNAAVAKLREGRPDTESVFAIAGFAAYVASCSPAAMRIHSEPIAKAVHTTAEILEKKGLLPPPPASLGAGSLSEMLDDGRVAAKIDPKFPQAFGISSIIKRTALFGNAAWEVLFNDESGSPFFTSDYPIALEAVSGSRVPNWIVPLTPTVALRFIPDLRMRGREADLSFPSFSFERKRLSHQEVRSINTLIVRCAEDSALLPRRPQLGAPLCRAQPPLPYRRSDGSRPDGWRRFERLAAADRRATAGDGAAGNPNFIVYASASDRRFWLRLRV